MYNLRYHIASLVAVFLALAIGLLLGTVVADRGGLNSQRASLASITKQLQTQFTGLKKENDDLRRDRDRLKGFAQETVPLLTDGMLKGKSILVVTNAGRNDALAPVRDALKAAGADITVVTLKTKDLGRGDAALKGSLAEIATRTPGVSGAADPVAGALAAEWSKRGTPQPMTDQMRAANEVSIEGSSTDIAPDGVVLMASFDGLPDPALVSLVEAMHKSGAACVGAESQAAETGIGDAVGAAGLSAVDDVDRPEGGVSLVYVLAGRAEGRFGVKPGATALYPKLR